MNERDVLKPLWLRVSGRAMSARAELQVIIS